MTNCGDRCCSSLLRCGFLCWLVLAASCAAFATTKRPSYPLGTSFGLRAAATTEIPTTNKLQNLKVAISGAGPSGLLLAHRLLQNGAQVTLYESRGDPRKSEAVEAAKSGYAHAFGVGARGRTAIREGLDEVLWNAVKARGLQCDRCRMHIGRLRLKLRDTKPDVEPSLLIFQTDLCIALMEELERRYSDKVDLRFDSRIGGCSLGQKQITIEKGGNTLQESYDLLVGCDGVHSMVRKAMVDQASNYFTVTEKPLPGAYKVARLRKIPPKLDPESVSLMLPKKGPITAGCIPTMNGSCSLLFVTMKDTENTGKGSEPNIISQTQDDTTKMELAQLLSESYPPFEGIDFENVAEQLLEQKLGKSSSVVCNVYHYKDSVVLAGDAAHATGSSGQGVNSALVDSVALADCLLQNYDSSAKEASLKTSLATYSQQQVPEGMALHDLTMGPKVQGFKKARWLVKGARDSLFKGRFGIGMQPLHTLLTTSTEPFSSIRRKIDYYYEEPFPDEQTLRNSIANIYDEYATASDSAVAGR